MSNLNNGGLTRVLNYIKSWVSGLIPSKTSQLTNDSGYLTSHQSLSNYVTLNSSQTITATKTISANLNFSTTYTRGTAPSSTVYKDLFDYKDSAGNRICLFESSVATNKSSLNAIYAYNTSVASGGNIGYLGIGSKADGTVFTYAPTPSASDNSTQIATTAWVTAKNYLTSHQSLSSRVAKAGDTMTGTLSMSTENNVCFNLRPGNASWRDTISVQTGGNEAVVFATTNSLTSWMFINGEDSVTNHAQNRWQSLTPALQIKSNKVAIGKLIANGANLTYPLEVNGTISASSVVVTNNSSNGVLFGSYRVYVG